MYFTVSPTPYFTGTFTLLCDKSRPIDKCVFVAYIILFVIANKPMRVFCLFRCKRACILFRRDGYQDRVVLPKVYPNIDAVLDQL